MNELKMKRTQKNSEDSSKTVLKRVERRDLLELKREVFKIV
jgi:hypothetical protein